LFYYAGHGLQADGTNYLIPVDATLERPADLAFEAERLDDVISAMTVEDNTAIILLDACRSNPFVRNLSRARKSRGMDIGGGLAAVDAGTGVYIAFATQPGNVALDGDDGHSPFTAALLKHIATPAIDIEILMRRVRLDVMNATERHQVPWSNSSLVEPGFSFRPDARQNEAASSDSKDAPGPNANDLEFWRSIRDTSDIKLFRAYVAAFPAGTFIEIAKQRIATLGKPAVPKKKAPTHATKVQAAAKAQPAVPPASPKSKEPTRSAVSNQSIFAGTGSRCVDGNVERCRRNCKQGRRGACAILEKLQGQP
jgi:hypothetical protein